MLEPPIITFDCEWAPDFVYEDLARILTEKKIKSTWFATHESSFLKKLESNSLFEIGLHPNFSTNSTQGNNPDSILKNLKKIYPQAKSIRTHMLIQSSPLLLKFQHYGIENDSSLFLPKTENLSPHYSSFFKLFRFPFFWEDDVKMTEEKNWSLSSNDFLSISGLKIFNFHPIHIFLNSRDMENYNLMKKLVGLKSLNSKNVKKFINFTNPGTRNYFEKIISSLEDIKSFTIQDLRELYFKNF